MMHPATPTHGRESRESHLPSRRRAHVPPRPRPTHSTSAESPGESNRVYGTTTVALGHHIHIIKRRVDDSPSTLPATLPSTISQTYIAKKESRESVRGRGPYEAPRGHASTCARVRTHVHAHTHDLYALRRRGGNDMAASANTLPTLRKPHLTDQNHSRKSPAESQRRVSDSPEYSPETQRIQGVLKERKAMHYADLQTKHRHGEPRGEQGEPRGASLASGDLHNICACRGHVQW